LAAENDVCLIICGMQKPIVSFGSGNK